MSRVEAFGQFPEQSRPIRLALLVEEGLAGGDIFQPDEGIVALAVLQARLIQLPCQPLTTIEANVNAEGEPGLNACMHEAEERMNLIMIQMHALALTVVDLQAF